MTGCACPDHGWHGHEQVLPQDGEIGSPRDPGCGSASDVLPRGICCCSGKPKNITLQSVRIEISLFSIFRCTAYVIRLATFCFFFTCSTPLPSLFLLAGHGRCFIISRNIPYRSILIFSSPVVCFFLLSFQFSVAFGVTCLFPKYVYDTMYKVCFHARLARRGSLDL